MCGFESVTPEQWERYLAGCDSVERGQWKGFSCEDSSPCTCEELRLAIHDERFSEIQDVLRGEFYSRC